MAGVQVLVGVVIVAVVISLLLSKPDRSRVSTISNLGAMSVGSTEDGRARMIKVANPKGDPDAQSIITRTIFPWHMFALGILTGICVATFVSKIVHPASAPWNVVAWMFLWLSVVGFVWLMSTVVERRQIMRMRRRGKFDELLAAGVDPIQIAAAFQHSARRFTTACIVYTFAGGALLTALDRRGALISAAMLAVALVYWWYAGREDARWFTPVELLDRFRSFREHLFDGGWVAPAGLLLFAASFELLHFARFETSLIVFVAGVGIALVLWSERASRVAAQAMRLDEFRTRLRDLLVNREADSAVQVF
jgi:hypothetical protein